MMMRIIILLPQLPLIKISLDTNCVPYNYIYSLSCEQPQSPKAHDVMPGLVSYIRWDDYRNRWSRTSLHHACMEGRLNVVRYLVEDAKVDTPHVQMRMTSLHYLYLRRSKLLNITVSVSVTLSIHFTAYIYIYKQYFSHSHAQDCIIIIIIIAKWITTAVFQSSLLNTLKLITIYIFCVFIYLHFDIIITIIDVSIFR